MFTMFGQDGGHALQLAYDWEHTQKVDKAIANLSGLRGSARQDQFLYALRSAGLSENELTEDDVARMMQELG